MERLLQLGEFRTGRFKNGKVWICRLPQFQESLIGRACCTCRAGHCLRARLTEKPQSSRPAIPDNASIIAQFLEFAERWPSPLDCQVSLAPQIRRDHAGITQIADELAALVRLHR